MFVAIFIGNEKSTKPIPRLQQFASNVGCARQKPHEVIEPNKTKYSEQISAYAPSMSAAAMAS